MALVLGTNCGLVTVAPTDDPSEALNLTVDGTGRGQLVTVPAGGVTITEVGWWCSSVNDETNYEVGIYSKQALYYLPENLLHVSRTHAKGTTAGWKRASGLSWALSEGAHFIALQVDDTPTNTTIRRNASYSGEHTTGKTPLDTLPDPPISWTDTANHMIALYALYETGGGQSVVPAIMHNYRMRRS